MGSSGRHDGGVPIVEQIARAEARRRLWFRALFAATWLVFIGGLEGVAFNMIPLSVTDGGKLFRWRRSVWASVALLAGFLFWHVLLNSDRQFFDALRQAESLAVLALFLLYTGLSFGLWAYFRWRPGSTAPTPQPE